MTLINLVIKLIGPTPEKTLTVLLLLIQVSGQKVGSVACSEAPSKGRGEGSLGQP